MIVNKYSRSPRLREQAAAATIPPPPVSGDLNSQPELYTKCPLDINIPVKRTSCAAPKFSPASVWPFQL